MKLKVSVTVELTKEQVRHLANQAKMSGHGHDGTRAPGRLIRRLLEAKVNDTVTYCYEKSVKEGDEDEDRN